VKASGNANEFMNNSKKSYDIADNLFRKKPAMLFDFQALLDMKGNLFFIDIDGHLDFAPASWGNDHIKNRELCMKKIERVRNLVREA